MTAVTAQETITLTYLVDDSQNAQEVARALTEAYTARNPNVTFVIELRPPGTEGDNIVKTRLATGDMADLFYYNTGSLLQALNPAQTLVDLADQPFIDNIVESFLPPVTLGERIFGVPTGTAMGGGILYNKRVYENLGLSVPLTWDEFVANNAVIAEAGIAPVLATFGDTWSAQLFVLADYYNVAQAVPDFAERYTANQAKIATTPEAAAGFTYLQQGYELGWWQRDFATTRFEPGLALLANGEAAHYPMLTFALSTIAANFPDQVNDIGFFAQPGSSADANGVTIWMPAGTYIPQTTQGARREAAIDFLGFIASVEGTEAITARVVPNGPYLIRGATLPETVLPAVQQFAAYIDAGNSYPALEFLSPIKGPNLEQLCVAVGTGQMSAAAAAASYDLDVERQAQQLGLPGW
jgi:raffinose/stachyose/melibiose transport system substrate-binding protein